MVATLGAESNKRCHRLKYQIKYMVQINLIAFTAKSIVPFESKSRIVVLVPFVPGLGAPTEALGFMFDFVLHRKLSPT